MRFALPLVPTARAAWLAALAAPAALIIAAALPQAWIVAPAAAIALLALVLLDGAIAGRIGDCRLHVPDDVELGGDFHAELLVDFVGGRIGTCEAALSCDPRLAEGGQVRWELIADGTDTWRGRATLRAERRGTGAYEALWIRWKGPLGLGARQVKVALDRSTRVWPDLSPVRSPELQTFLRDAQFGLIARRIRGEGTQFEALSEYEPGMDRRRIDWKASARHTRLYARENESERNNQIVFAFDCGQTMCEPVDGLPRIDRAVSAALTAAYVALKGGDRISLFGFAARPELSTPFYGDARNFFRLQSAAAGLDYRSQEPNFTLALATLSARLQRRSLIVLFSDFADPTGAELMIESVARLVRRHLVLFVTMEDSELSGLAAQAPENIDALAQAVTADTLSRQRALVLQKLRQRGVDVIEAPWDRIGYDLIDRYLDIKRSGAIG